MKVDLVTPRFHPSVGGIEESVTQLALALQRRKHEVVVHTAQVGASPPAEAWRGIPIRRYPLVLDRGFYVSRFEPSLSGEIIHLHAYAHQTNDWVVRRYGQERPIVYSTHHGIRFPKPRLLAKAYHAWYNQFRGLPTLCRTQKVLVPTQVDRDEFARRGVDPDRIAVVPSGADEDAFGRHPRWAPAGVEGEFLLFLGRLHAEKGVPDLVRAFRRSPPGLPLVLAGRDDGALSELGALPSGVHTVTSFDAARKWGLLEGCRALVLPSRYEGQGIVVAEAWAKRKPVVATRAGALRAVVDDGRNGLLVDVGDEEGLAEAMRRLTQDAPLAKRLGEAGRAEAERTYRWSAIVERVEGIYREALNARR